MSEVEWTWNPDVPDGGGHLVLNYGQDGPHGENNENDVKRGFVDCNGHPHSIRSGDTYIRFDRNWGSDRSSGFSLARAGKFVMKFQLLQTVWYELTEEEAVSFGADFERLAALERQTPDLCLRRHVKNCRICSPFGSIHRQRKHECGTAQRLRSNVARAQ